MCLHTRRYVCVYIGLRVVMYMHMYTYMHIHIHARQRLERPSQFCISNCILPRDIRRLLIKYTCIFVLDVLFTNMFVKEPYICIHMYLYSNRLYTYQWVSAHEISGGSLRIVNMSAADFCTRALHICKKTLCVCIHEICTSQCLLTF